MSSFKKMGGLQFQIRPFTKEDADLDAELAAEKSNDVLGFLSPDVADIYNRFTGNTPQTSTSDQLAEAMQRVANPNRVSELVGLGILQYVSRKPLLFAREHCRDCYRDYRWWLTVREPGENYVKPKLREAADFGE